MDAATLDDLLAMADAGQMDVPDRLWLEVNDLAPEAGSQVLLIWHSEGDGLDGLHLLMPDGQRLAVPAAGRRALAVGAELIVVALVSGATQAEVRIQPRVAVPQVQLDLVAPLVLDMPSTIRWATQNAESVRLRLIQGEQVAEEVVPARGERRFIPDSLVPVRFEMIASSRHAHLTDTARVRRVLEVPVRPIVPAIRLWRVEPLPVLGQPVAIEWDVAEAVGVNIVIAGEVRHAGDAVGSFEFVPVGLGPLEVTLEAHSRHAVISHLATIRETQRLHVAAPPIEIRLSDSEQCVLPGGEAAFHWTLLGVVEAILEVPGRGERYELPLTGSLYVTAEILEEVFHLHATGYDGRTKDATLRVRPVIPDISGHLDELALLADPIDEVDLLRSEI